MKGKKSQVVHNPNKLNMKANELRIGNLVLCDEEIIKISSINEYGVELFKDEDSDNESGIYHTYGIDELIHIPLTEEWLVKFGFGHDGVAPGRLKLDCDLGEIMINFNSLNPLCKYVHQLQNLYFALTGNELTINQTK